MGWGRFVLYATPLRIGFPLPSLFWRNDGRWQGGPIPDGKDGRGWEWGWGWWGGRAYGDVRVCSLLVDGVEEWGDGGLTRVPEGPC